MTSQDDSALCVKSNTVLSEERLQRLRRLQPLSGSYPLEDCQFLLTEIVAEYQTVADKERLIQSGQLHYSELIHQESAPSDEYLQLFLHLTLQYKQRLAQELVRLAQLIAQKRSGPITLISLARAGTPIGVLLQKTLTQCLQRDANHYSISIIRDRGIDTNALDYLLYIKEHNPDSFVFIDGWTAKGVITRELKAAIVDYNRSRKVNISNELFVVSDIGGTADVAATYDDYTIPSALMNSTVSGLISRSILNKQIGEHEFHGCVSYQNLKEHDRSNWFVDQIFANVKMQVNASTPHVVGVEDKEALNSLRARTQQFLADIQKRFAVSDINRIKPGVAEATRVMLRRVPDVLLVREKNHPDVLHLEQLAKEKGIPVYEEPTMPFGACALIKDVLKKG